MTVPTWSTDETHRIEASSALGSFLEWSFLEQNGKRLTWHDEFIPGKEFYIMALGQGHTPEKAFAALETSKADHWARAGKAGRI